jgi:hypothetical protein
MLKSQANCSHCHWKFGWKAMCEAQRHGISPLSQTGAGNFARNILADHIEYSNHVGCISDSRFKCHSDSKRDQPAIWRLSHYVEGHLTTRQKRKGVLTLDFASPATYQPRDRAAMAAATPSCKSISNIKYTTKLTPFARNQSVKLHGQNQTLNIFYVFTSHIHC